MRERSLHIANRAPFKARMRLTVDYLETHEGTTRLEAFSDGVFSIAATLLVLDIQVPRSASSASQLLDALIRLWPVYISYAFSFIYIGIYWANHHFIFQRFRRTDRLFVMLNMLFLLLIAAIPFPTALLAEYLRASGGQQRIAVLVYSGIMTLAAVLFLSMWLYATHRHRLVDSNLNEREIRAITRQNQFGPLMYVASFFIGFWYWKVSLIIYLIATLFYCLPVRVIWRMKDSIDEEER